MWKKRWVASSLKSVNMFQPLSPGLFAAGKRRVRLLNIQVHVNGAPLCFPSLFSEYTRYGKHQGQKALWGQPSRKLQKTSNRPVSFRKKRFETCYTLYASHSLILTPRAVEFFIRDKYEKKKYYSEKVTNGSSVGTNSFLMILCNFYTFNCFFPFVAFCQPKDAKKERDTDRGSRASSYSKVSKLHEFLLSQILFFHALFLKK